MKDLYVHCDRFHYSTKEKCQRRSRQNTVPHDKSIDDEEQACLFFSDGHWFIEDRSSDNSTYVHAGAGIKLEPGDIIRMGDRLFEFNIKSRKQ